MRSILPLFAAAFLASAPALATEVVTVPQFHSVELRGGGSVDVVPGPTQRVTIVEGSSQITHLYVEPERKLRIDVCERDCPRGYRLRVEIQSPEVPHLAVDGGGAMSVASGFRPQDHLAVAVNGGGHIDARAVDTTHVSAAVNGGGELLVHPRNSLSAAVNGGGHIRYWGDPSTTVAIHGGGSVSRGY